jgi:hypothetical protein
MPHPKHVQCFAHVANTLPTVKSISTLHPQIHKIAHLGCTPTTLGLCCLLQCTIMKDHRKAGTACLLLALTYRNERPMKNQCQGSRFLGKHKSKRNQWITRRQRLRNEEVRSWEYENHKVQKDLWSWFGRIMKLLRVKVHYHEFEDVTCQVG